MAKTERGSRWKEKRKDREQEWLCAAMIGLTTPSRREGAPTLGKKKARSEERALNVCSRERLARNLA